MCIMTLLTSFVLYKQGNDILVFLYILFDSPCLLWARTKDKIRYISKLCVDYHTYVTRLNTRLNRHRYISEQVD